MKNQSKPIFIISCFLLFILFLFTHSTSVTAQEVEDERNFDYIEGSKKGPAFWGDIKREWAACKNGRLQSPIDLSSLRVTTIPSLVGLKTTYKSSNATLKNRGHDIKLEWAGYSGSIEVDGIEYHLQQSHWHSPSEHSINGRRYAMELHMVYQSPDPKVENNVVVVGVLYQIGRPNAFLSKLMRDVAFMTDEKTERSIGVIDPAEIVQLNGNNYYKYIGSLTIPPCTEGVIWIISKQLGTVSKEQIDLLRAAVYDYAEMNARPVQPLNLRKIFSFYGKNAKNKHN
ncbi:alpha carbonic anhydrase 7 isoform X2 [Pyrus x bretschneideri]|uniref:alpha carbonic anhydrase 7 isoform X2 n=1 Tax=Pyrus x bretschneideri TaxID=225117 RepID=UPI0020300D6B|nr:alpha carbonic anhydrase 7 isoform X2 [Pyrus x bretschneideri]